ncbi:myelin regulatory factor-like protein isoform X3 [Palaemon carinicauda]|uniref:myelin regulatory factor-like protein isoform X3 n=1 Tax=Palaemon carinicauda TaxID=392227 RepID=UPI0035B64571
MEHAYELRQFCGGGDLRPVDRYYPSQERDWEGGIDNEGLDISQLESYINNDDTSDATLYFGDLQGVGDIKALGNVTPRDSPSRHLHHQNLHHHQSLHQQHHLPDSPPDSGSEPPYSPPDHPNLSPHQKTQSVTELYPNSSGGGGTAPMVIFPYTVMQNQQQQQQQQQQPQPLQQQHPANPPHNPTHNSGIGNLPTHNPSNMAYQPPSVVLGGGNMMGTTGIPQNTSSAYSPNGNQIPSITPLGTSTGSTTPLAGGGGGGSNAGCSIPVGKKRKINDSSGLANPVYIKEEPDQSAVHQLQPNSSVTTYCEEDEYTMDSNNGPYMDSSYQCIKFHNFQQQTWSVICDAGLKELNLLTFRVDADKGFNFSNPDDAFVCQKKNHFQVTVHFQTACEPVFVKTPEGLQKIDCFYVHFFGVKTESPSQAIRVEQSQSDRTKKAFHPVPVRSLSNRVELKPEQMGKITVGRLHFSETTSNNMRKKGKPNPDQRYFYLVVSLKAHCGENSYTLAAQASEKIIVRASNPGQFESDVEYTFQRGTYPESIYHMGRVGVNTDRPDEALVINGNLKVTGQFLQPSDKRAKKDVEEVDTREQLKNVSNLRVVTYAYKDEFAETAGIRPDEVFDTGVIAQEVKEVIPDAVKTTGDLTLSNGDKIDNFLFVNKDRIFMENVGAVKELCKVTGNLENRIGELEKMNKKIAQLKRMESFKSTTSSISTRTSGTSRMSSVSVKGRGCSGRRHKPLRGGHDEGFCNNKTLQLTTITLVCIMAFCLMAMAVIYILDYQGRNDPTTTTATTTTMATTTTTTTTIVLSSSMGTTTSTTTDEGTLTSLIFTTKPSYGTTSWTTTPSTTVPPTPIQPRPPIIGRPEDCRETPPGDDPICTVYCCREEVGAYHLAPATYSTGITVTRRITGPLGYTTFPPTNSRYSELHTNKVSTNDPNIVNDSTTLSNLRTKSMPSKKSNGQHTWGPSSRLSRPANSRSIKQILSKRSLQSKRSTGNSAEIFRPQATFTRIPIIEITNFNTTITHLYCLNSSDEYEACMDNTANNFTYLLPISRFMTERDLTVRFKYGTLDSYRQPSVCQNCSHCSQPYPSIRCEDSPEQVVTTPVEEDPSQPPPDHDFVLHGVGMWSQTAYKFRIPVSNHVETDEGLCDLPAEDLGHTFYEINLIFKRMCYG